MNFVNTVYIGIVIYSTTFIFMLSCINRASSLTWPVSIKFIGTEESVLIRKEFNSHRNGLKHQHGCRFIVLGHQYGRRVVMWKRSIRHGKMIDQRTKPSWDINTTHVTFWVGGSAVYPCVTPLSKNRWFPGQISIYPQELTVWLATLNRLIWCISTSRIIVSVVNSLRQEKASDHFVKLFCNLNCLSHKEGRKIIL